jgi:hypothetical protein
MATLRISAVMFGCIGEGGSIGVDSIKVWMCSFNFGNSQEMDG